MNDHGSNLNEFLVRAEINTGHLDLGCLTELRRAEPDQASELASDGWLRAVGRVPSAWANYEIWAAHSEDELPALLRCPPLSRCMSLTVQKREPHSSGPCESRRSW